MPMVSSFLAQFKYAPMPAVSKKILPNNQKIGVPMASG